MKYLYEYKNNYMKFWFGDSKIVNEDGKPLIVYHGTSDIIDEFEEDFCGSNTCNNHYGAFYFTSSKEVADDYSKQSFIRKYNYYDKESIMDYGFTEEETEEISNNIEEVAVKYIKTISAYLKMENPYIIEGNGEVADVDRTQKIINVLKNGAYEEDVWYDIYDDLSYEGDDLEENRDEIEDRARSNYELDEDDDIEEYMFIEAAEEIIGPLEINYDGIIYKNCNDAISEESMIITDVYIVFYPSQIKSTNSELFSPYTNKIHEEIKKFNNF